MSGLICVKCCSRCFYGGPYQRCRGSHYVCTTIMSYRETGQGFYRALLKAKLWEERQEARGAAMLTNEVKHGLIGNR